MNHWKCLPRNGYGNDVEYRSSLLTTLDIGDTEPDVDLLTIKKVDELYKDVGSHFKECIAGLRGSPSRAQYIMLYGPEPTDADLFVFLLSFDTFFHFSKCVDQLVANQKIDSEAMAPLLRICSM